MINVLSTIATILSLGGNLLLAKQDKRVFPIWIVANVMWVYIIATTSMNISQIIMYIVYIGTSINSWIQWSEKDKKSVDKVVIE